MADRERRLQHSPLAADDDEHLTPASLERLRSLERDYRSSRVSMWACLFQENKGVEIQGRGGCLKCGWIYTHLLTILSSYLY